MSNNINIPDTSKNTEIEPILQEVPDRYVLFPIKYHSFWEIYKRSVSVFWSVEEIDLSQDKSDWENLTDDEKHFIKYILAFFAGSDGIVLENLGLRFLKEIQVPEARCFYGLQMAMENIHSETYSLLIDTYITNEIEKDFLLNAIENIPCIKKKADWAIKWINDDESKFAQRLVAFAAVEGIFFSGAFCSIYWIKDKKKMPGLTFSNELISRDEGLHTEFAVLVYKELINKLPESTVHEIISEAVDIEKEFIVDAIPCRLLGMNSELMTEYIQFCADRLLVQLGYNKLYNANQPFDFMEKISLSGKTNFFERRVGEYEKPNITGNTSKSFTLSADF